MKNLFSVEEKVAIVTGGAHGLGLSYAKGLLDHGARVAICDVNEQFLADARKELAKYGESAMAGQVDVTSAEQISAFVRKVVDRFGQVDILLNNAGVVLRKWPEDMDGNDWDFVMNINVKGTFLFATEVGRWMIANQRKGKIINIASQAGYRAADRRLAYCTSKASIVHFTRTLANEWGKYGINVNAIAPGYIISDMNKDLRADETRYKAMRDEVPLGDFGMPEDITGTVIYLSSAASDYITGVIVPADGGLIVK